MTPYKPPLRPLVSEIIPVMAIVVLQTVACLFFVADALSDDSGPNPLSAENALETVVAFALLAGIALGAMFIVQLIREVRVRARVVAVATGALSEIISDRFSDWRLSPAEADVALFALKGFAVREIAQLRCAAEGTVRAQLSQVYAKAGVSSQVMLMSLFLEDLMDGAGAAPSERS